MHVEVTWASLGVIEVGLEAAAETLGFVRFKSIVPNILASSHKLILNTRNVV